MLFDWYQRCEYFVLFLSLKNNTMMRYASSDLRLEILNRYFQILLSLFEGSLKCQTNQPRRKLNITHWCPSFYTNPISNLFLNLIINDMNKKEQQVDNW